MNGWPVSVLSLGNGGETIIGKAIIYYSKGYYI